MRTPQKKREEELKESEQIFRSIFDNAADGILLADVENKKFHIGNKAICQMLGYNPEEIKNMAVMDIHPKEDLSYVIDQFERQSRREFSLTKDMPVRRKDGSVFYADINTFPITFGEKTYLMGIFRDVTERKQAEEVCRLSEEKFAKAFNSSPAAIFITTLKEGRFIDLNEIAIKVFGYTREEVVGHAAKELNMWANYNDRDIVVQSIRREIAVRDMEARFRRKSGEVFDCIISVDIINIGGTECLISTIVDITERKQAEDALQKSEESGRAILDATTESVLLIDKQGTILTINKTGARRFGRSVEELVGTNVWDVALGLIPPDLIKSRREQIDKVLHSGKPLRFEDRRKEKIFDNNIYPIFDEKGQVTRLAIFARDVTEQRKAEEMLRELKYRYQTLFESTPVGIGVSTPEGQVLECNDAMLQMTGYSLAELKRINLADTYQEPQLREALLRRLQTDGCVHDFEAQLKRKDGTAYYASLTITPLTLGGQGMLLTVQKDVTERRRYEDSLERSENKYRTLLENLPQKIFLKDRDSVYMSCNENYARDMKIKPEEIAGKTDYDFYHKKLAEKYRADDKRIMEGGKTEDIEEKYIQGGQELIVRTVKTPVKDAKGRVSGILGIFWDITREKRTQEELQKYHEKMIRAEQLASLGALGATLVHELAQPLTVITLSIENVLTKLKTMSCPRTVTKKLKDSLDGVSDITSIVERFRNYAKKSSKGITEEVSLKPVAERTMKLLSESARQVKVTLRLKGLDKLPPVYSNEKDIEQVFFALVENAIEAANGKRDRHVVISGTVDGGYVKLRFADNCGGIAVENLEKIFEPFFTTKPAGERTGLGLCIVEHVVSRAGGKVRVESKAGKGSTFFVTLPINAGKKP